jgi:hypothetical protein
MKKGLIFIFLFSLVGYSQTGGENIFNFLNLSSSARQTSLGGNVLTILDNVNQPIWNPASITNEIDNNLSFNYVNYLADVSITSVSFAHMINRQIGTFHTNITYLNYGKFIGADETGIETGSFKAYDFLFSLGYSYNILNSDFHIGANVKVINSVIENYSSLGIGGDFALLFSNEYVPYVFTVVVRNLGYQLSVYDSTREKLPFQVDFGASYKLENVPLTWYFTIDNLQQWKLAFSNPSNQTQDLNGNVTQEKISFFDNAFRHISVGAELFSEGVFNLRFGYNFRRAKELKFVDQRSFAGFTAGFGIKMNKFKLNYAFSKYHPAANSSTFSLLIDLN